MSTKTLKELIKKHRIPTVGLSQKEQISILVDRGIIPDMNYTFDEEGVFIGVKDNKEYLNRVKKALSLSLEKEAREYMQNRPQQKGAAKMRGKKEEKATPVGYDPEAELRKALRKVEPAIEETLSFDDVVKEQVTINIKEAIRLHGTEVIASEIEKIDGLEIYPYYTEGDNNLKVKFIKVQDIPVGKNTPTFKYIQDGLITPMRLKVHDPELRVKVLYEAMLEAQRLTSGKGKECKFIVCKEKGGISSEDGVYFLGTRKVLNDIFKCDVTQSDIIKLWGYNSPTRIEIETDKTLKLLVVDSKTWALRVLTDGQLHFDIDQFTYDAYISERKIREGKRQEVREINNEAQIRALIPCVIKGKGVFSSKFHHDHCLSWGFNPDDYDGITDVANLKTGGYKHGDVITLKTRDIRVINILSTKINPRTGDPTSGSSVGVQLTCADQVATYNLFNELGGKEKAHMWVKAARMEYEGIKYLLGIDVEGTFEDADIIEIQTLGMAMNQKGEWRVPSYKTNRNRINARLLVAYREDVLKYRTAKYRPYITACPALLVRLFDGQLDMLANIVKDNYPMTYNEVLEKYKGRIDDALSFFEREWRDTHNGEIVNFVILPNNEKFLEHYFSKKNRAGARAPIVGPASVQGQTPLPKKYFELIENFGFKSFSWNEEYNCVVHDGNTGIIISQSYAICLNADYDGDNMDLIISDTAEYAARRPKYPDVAKPSKDEPVELTDDEFIEWLNKKYYIVAMSANDIGIVDLTARFIIEYYRQLGKELDPDRIDIIGFIRELVIQLKKHVSGKTGALNEEMQNAAEYIIRRFAPDGHLPQPWEAPITHKLKLSGLGLPAKERWLSNMLEQIVSLSKATLHLDYTKRDAHRDNWRILSNATFPMNEWDAEWWKTQFEFMWEKIRAKDPSFSTLPISNLTLAKIANLAKKIKATYAPKAREYNKVRDDIARRKLFTDLRNGIRSEYGIAIRDIAGYDQTKEYIVRKALAVALGVISFGAGISQREDGEAGEYSMAGGAFFYMGNDVLVDILSSINPNNPYFVKVDILSGGNIIKSGYINFVPEISERQRTITVHLYGKQYACGKVHTVVEGKHYQLGLVEVKTQ